VQPGDYVVVLGGGPIGLLVALVAKVSGARTLISEINPFRLSLIRELGVEAVDPREVDLSRRVEEETAGAGADVVFEVSSASSNAAVMTALARTRGRITIVGIFSEPQTVDLHRLFFREVEVIGSRVYEKVDFERAIELVAESKVPVERLISASYPLEEASEAFRVLDGGVGVMKVLIDLSSADGVLS
jgi:(R,R)-butanediol dehydrogenase/meso-butanediol dehydrogenase/diacetyl reductase